ncbi:MAG TPA: hypothetical protein VF228_17420 [Iamia sp.]
MTVREGLGRIFNVVYPADDVYINLRDCTSVAFVVHEVDGATQATVTFSDDASGTTTSTPDVIDHYYGSSPDQDNSGEWHKTTQTAAELVTPADTTEDLAVIEVNDEMAPDGMRYVKVTADGSATVLAILHGLQEQRDPANLPSPRV